jgi:archaeal flagellin FlaB
LNKVKNFTLGVNMYTKFLKDDKGFTGLEAAIVLIAFVVVAAVFSYVMLGAGFFTTQKSQEVVHTGVTQASSSIAPAGDVIVKGTASNTASDITFYITNTAGGTPVDLDKTILTYTDINQTKTNAYGTKGPGNGNKGWIYTAIVSDTATADNLLSAGEKYKVVIALSTFGITNLPPANAQFTLQLKPPEGAVLEITKTNPPVLTENNYYPVY